MEQERIGTAQSFGVSVIIQINAVGFQYIGRKQESRNLQYYIEGEEAGGRRSAHIPIALEHEHSPKRHRETPLHTIHSRTHCLASRAIQGVMSIFKR